MQMLRHTGFVLAILVAMVAAASAQRAPDAGPAPISTRTAAAGRAVSGAILARALDASGRPLPDTRIQVRSLRSGNVERAGTSDYAGTITFDRLAPGTFVLEMTVSNGSIVAISEAVPVTAGSTTEAAVQMASRVRNFAWWLGSTTTLALAQAASLGVLAVDGGQPVSPQQ